MGDAINASIPMHVCPGSGAESESASACEE